MDAMIFSCGTGGGHDAAAKAVLESMIRRGHHANMLNPYTLKSSRLANGINKTYIAAVRKAPHVFGAVYKLGDLYRQLPFYSPVYYVNRGMNMTLEDYIAQNPCDVALMTHLFPAEILTNMKRHGLKVPKMIFVATDYTCIPFTEETDCDAYVIPAFDLADEYEKRDIPKDKLYPFGIPVQEKFATEDSRALVRKRLGLDENKKYILVAGGSMGGGKIQKVITRLNEHYEHRKDVNLIVVCGNNKSLYDRLTEAHSPGMKVIGHTDDMASLIRGSDLYITKPGGLSSTEAAVSGIPILHVSPIPGCENHNARYFSGHGMSVYVETPSEILDAADQILSDDGIRDRMIRAQKEQIHSNAARKICELAEELDSQTV